MRTKLTVLAALVATAISSHATVYFSNKGTTSGWDTVNQQNGGTVRNTTAQRFAGFPTSIEATAYFKANSTTRFHSEVIKRNIGAIGQDRYYGFAFRLANAPDGWKVGSNHVITQIASDNGWWFALGINTGKIAGVSIPQGVWHRAVIRIKWSDTNTGIQQVWLNGVKVIEKLNQPMWTGKPPRWSLGIYEPNWHNKPSITSGLGTRRIYIGGARITSSYNEADPAKW